MTSLVPAPCGVSRRKVNAKLQIISDTTIDYAEKYMTIIRKPSKTISVADGFMGQRIFPVGREIIPGVWESCHQYQGSIQE